MDTFEGCGDMSDYNTWDVNACINLACEVARVQSEEYIRLYRKSKNTRLAKLTHREYLHKWLILKSFSKRDL